MIGAQIPQLPVLLLRSRGFPLGSRPGGLLDAEVSRSFARRQSVPWLVFLALVLAIATPEGSGVAAFKSADGASPTLNGDTTRLLRSPTVSATQIAFAYANNIWVVERAGGIARRLTSFQGQTTNPQFSPDGKSIAFSGEYAGNIDVYVVPAEGGEPKRLTWHPGADIVQGWTPDGKSVAVRVRPRDAGRRAARRASGPCRPKAASRSRCRCRAATRARSRPTARTSPTA